MLTTTFSILRHRHHVLVAELLRERRDDFLLILLFQPAHLSTTPSHLRQMRTLRPSPRILWPTRVCAPHSGQTSCTLRRVQRRLALDDAALDVLAGVRLRVALDQVHAFDDQAVLRPGSTFSTRPRLPRSLPVMTSTLSFFRIGVAKRDMTAVRFFRALPARAR